MRLENSGLLPLFIALFLVFLGSLLFKNIKIRRINFSNFIQLDKAGGRAQTGVLVVDLLKLLGIVLLIIALLRPQQVTKQSQDKIRGIDIMLALDLSGSMQAEDLKPNRMEAAKEVCSQFVSGLANDRVGLAVFAGKSFSQCPLTTDYEIVKNFINQLDLQTVRVNGTAMGDAIITAVNRLEKSGPTKVIILATDGVNNTGMPPVDAAKIAAYKGIKIYTIGIGKKGGAIMMGVGYDGVKRPVYNQYTGQMMKWEEPDEKTLTQIAEMTGGAYFRATDERALKQIYDTIGKLEKQDIQVKTYNRHEDRFAFFLWAGLLFILAGLGLEVFKYTRVIA
jgi:Ca-activated chloride channel homolog